MPIRKVSGLTPFDGEISVAICVPDSESTDTEETIKVRPTFVYFESSLITTRTITGTYWAEFKKGRRNYSAHTEPIVFARGEDMTIPIDGWTSSGARYSNEELSIYTGLTHNVIAYTLLQAGISPTLKTLLEVEEAIKKSAQDSANSSLLLWVMEKMLGVERVTS